MSAKYIDEMRFVAIDQWVIHLLLLLLILGYSMLSESKQHQVIVQLPTCNVFLKTYNRSYLGKYSNFDKTLDANLTFFHAQ